MTSMIGISNTKTRTCRHGCVKIGYCHPTSKVQELNTVSKLTEDLAVL